jgi:hypothetical protein
VIVHTRSFARDRCRERAHSRSFAVRRSPFAVRGSPFAVRGSPFALSMFQSEHLADGLQSVARRHAIARIRPAYWAAQPPNTLRTLRVLD